MDAHTLAQWADESFLVLVDSRMRDVDVWPTPSHYAINFNSPFDGVVELSLLDATVPRTEYIVDDDTNVVRYALGHPADLASWNGGGWAAGRERVAAVEPGDYGLAQFVVALNAALEAAAGLGEPALHASVLSEPGEVKNKVVLRCAQPFVMLMRESTLRHTLGFGDPVKGQVPGVYSTVPGWSTSRTGGASHAFCSVSMNTAAGVADDADTAFLGPVPGGYNVGTEIVTSARTMHQYFRSTASGTASVAWVYAASASAHESADLVVRIRRDDAGGEVLATGTAELPPRSVNEEFEPRRVNLTVFSTPGQLIAGDSYRIEFYVMHGSAMVYTNEPNAVVPDGSRLEVHTSAGGITRPAVVACVDVRVNARGHAVISPGVVNLSGPRYVNIRCPEIESHMYRDRVTERTNAGLGMVKLRGTGFREQRYDFVSFPPRRFHPIDKLSRLTFVLTRPDGTLYDSNGVDHTLLLGLKYKVPPASTAVPRLLNPSYDPEFSTFLSSRLRRDAEAQDASRRNLM